MTTTTDNEATPAAAAVVYGLHGLRVVPVRGKVPPIKAWQDVATNDTAAIRELFARPEHATDGVSIVTGRESGVFVVDVDVANGKPGMESLEELERRIGPLPKGPVARTPSGGIHLYFATDGREIRNSAGNVLGPGLDVRGEGGQVVAPPTCRGDACYRWEEDRSPMDLEPPTAPALLELLAAEPIREPRESRRVDPHTGEILGRDTPAWVNEFNRSHTWPELLAGDGWTHDETDPNGDAHWTRPEKETRKGSSATVYADTDCLHVFTTSIPWLPAGTTVDRYGYMVHRRYGGDFKAAAHALKPSSNGKLRGIVHDVAGLVASTVGAATHAVVTKLRPDEGELEAVNLPDEFWNARRVVGPYQAGGAESAPITRRGVARRPVPWLPGSPAIPSSCRRSWDRGQICAISPPSAGRPVAANHRRTPSAASSCRCQPTSLPASSTSCRSALAKD